MNGRYCIERGGYVTFGFSRKITKTTGNETKLIRTKDKHARGRGIPASFRPFRRETRKIESTNQRMDVLAAKEVLLNPVKPPPLMEERKGLKGATKEPSYRRCSSSGAERKRDK